MFILSILAQRLAGPVPTENDPSPGESGGVFVSPFSVSFWFISCFMALATLENLDALLQLRQDTRLGHKPMFPVRGTTRFSTIRGVSEVASSVKFIVQKV